MDVIRFGILVEPRPQRVGRSMDRQRRKHPSIGAST